MERRGDSALDAGIVRSVAVAAVSAEIPQEIPNFEPTIVNRPARAAKRTLKTVVFNARTGARFDGILACLRRPPLADADVIMLCEADWRMRRSAGREIAADLAAAARYELRLWSRVRESAFVAPGLGLSRQCDSE